MNLYHLNLYIHVLYGTIETQHKLFGWQEIYKDAGGQVPYKQEKT